MKRLSIGILISLTLTACEGTQDITTFEATELIDLDFHVNINDQDMGSIPIASLADHIKTVYTNLGNPRTGIPVSEIIRQTLQIDNDAELEAVLAQYICDYQSNDDGFRPSSKGERCPMVPCTETMHTYIDAYSGSVFLEDTSPLTNSCYNVRNISNEAADKNTPSHIAAVLLYTANPNAITVWVYYNGEKTGRNVDLDALDHHSVSGRDAVLVSDILQEAGIHDSLETALCDIRIGESAHTVATSNPDCGRLQCTDFSEQYIYLDGQELSISRDTCPSAPVKAIYVTQQFDTYPSHIVTISIDGRDIPIDLAGLRDRATIIDNNEVIMLSDLFDAAGITLDLSSSLCDYVSTDGYRPADKDSCRTIRTCEDANSAYISLYAHNLHLENAKSCYNVGDIGAIEIQTHARPQTIFSRSYPVKIFYNKQLKSTVDIATLSDRVVSLGDKQVLYVSSILSAAIPDFDFAAHYCDTLGSDGWYPAVQDKCEEVFPCTFMQQAYIDITDTEFYQLNPPAGIPSCYATKFLDSIKVTTSNPN